jgi:hypothetical protein
MERPCVPGAAPSSLRGVSAPPGVLPSPGHGALATARSRSRSTRRPPRGAASQPRPTRSPALPLSHSPAPVRRARRRSPVCGPVSVRTLGAALPFPPAWRAQSRPPRRVPGAPPRPGPVPLPGPWRPGLASHGARSWRGPGSPPAPACPVPPASACPAPPGAAVACRPQRGLELGPACLWRTALSSASAWPRAVDLGMAPLPLTAHNTARARPVRDASARPCARVLAWCTRCFGMARRAPRRARLPLDVPVYPPPPRVFYAR